MPRLVGPLRRSWAIGTDDFALLCPGSFVFHGACAFVAAWPAVRSHALPGSLCKANWQLSCLTMFLDLVMTVCSSQGGVLDVDKRHAVPLLFRLRLLSGALHLAVVLVSVGAWLLSAPADEPCAWSWAWVCEWALPMLLVAQMAWYVFAVAACVMLSKPLRRRHEAEGFSMAALRVTLKWFGANDRIVSVILEMLMNLLSDIDLVPSDVVVGLLLVAERYRRRESTRPLDCVTPTAWLDGQQSSDRVALEELNRYVTYAVGIYGFGMVVIGESAHAGTWLVMPHRLVKACLRALPCAQNSAYGGRAPSAEPWFCCPPRQGVESDGCFALNSYALRRAIAAGAGGHNVELLWGTWECAGIASAPPFAVLLDHTTQEMIITIRGTMSIQDVIIDVACKPAPYRPPAPPKNKAQKGAGLHDQDADFHVHVGILACMRDVKTRLLERGIIAEVSNPAGRAFGYGVVCTGHSLGAGIAVLLALELRAELGDGVRFVGFEPPGCVVCPALAREIEGLGWYSAVIAESWVPRLSLRNLQLLREQVLDELAFCRQSKLRLAASLPLQTLRPTFRSCLTRIFYYCCRMPFGGASNLIRSRFAAFCGSALRMRSADAAEPTLRVDDNFQDRRSRCAAVSTGEALYRERLMRRADPDFYAAKMECPGRPVLLRPRETERVCGLCSRDTLWTAEWGKPSDIEGLLVTPRTVEYHFPFILADALRRTHLPGSTQHNIRDSRPWTFFSARSAAHLASPTQPSQIEMQV